MMSQPLIQSTPYYRLGTSARCKASQYKYLLDMYSKKCILQLNKTFIDRLSLRLQFMLQLKSLKIRLLSLVNVRFLRFLNFKKLKNGYFSEDIDTSTTNSRLIFQLLHVYTSRLSIDVLIFEAKLICKELWQIQQPKKVELQVPDSTD